jgi:hypothetical protein
VAVAADAAVMAMAAAVAAAVMAAAAAAGIESVVTRLVAGVFEGRTRVDPRSSAIHH